MDSLEQRRLMSFGIEGTPGDDNFIISVAGDKIHLQFNGGIEVYDAPADGFVSVNGYAGNDTFWLQNTGALKFTLGGFAGDDKYIVGSGHLVADVRRDVHIVDLPPSPNHGGVDLLTIDDSLSPGTVFTVDDFGLSFVSLSSPTIFYNMTPDDSVSLVCGGGDDIVEIRKMRPNLSIRLGDGDDMVDFGGPDHVVSDSFPTGTMIDPGNGNDLMVIDDSSPLSNRTNIRVSQLPSALGQPAQFRVLDTVGVAGFFDRMRIQTHVLSNNQPEPVIFTGVNCPASRVTVIGTDGPDLVQVGSFFEPIDSALLYADEIAVKLGTGQNNLEINEADGAPSHSWTLDGDKLDSGGVLKLRNQLPVVGTTGTVDVLVRGTRGADNFFVKQGPSFWNVTLDGGLGDDTFQQYPGAIDLDDTFVGRVKFDGGPGVDTVTLVDSGDQVGDDDTYFITSRSIRKADAGQPLQTLVEFAFIDNLSVTCDDDANVIYYDVAGLKTVDIFGGGGGDTFINRNEATGLPVFVNSLAAMTRLHGGAGSNHLGLDDRSGEAGSYDLGASEFIYTCETSTLKVQFDGMSSIDVQGSDQANTAIVRGKPQNVVLSFAGNGGDDLFIVGGGDIDGSGLALTTLAGGAGNDHIRFDDRFNDHSSFDGDVLTLEFQSASKDGVAIAHGGFESQSVLTSGVNNSPLAFANTVRVNAISMPTEIFDTPGVRDTIVEVGHGPAGLSQILAPLTLTSTAVMELKLFDLLSTTPKQFIVDDSKIIQNNSPQLLNISHSGLGAISIFAGNTSDQFVVNAVAAGTQVFCSGGGGDDQVFVGNGSLSSIHGPVHFDGGAGSADQMNISNLFDFESSPIAAMLTGGTLTIGEGPVHQFSNGVECMNLGLFSSAGVDLRINSTQAAVTIIGGAGDDRVTVANLMNNVAFHGGPEINGDTIIIDDSVGAGNDSYTFDAGNTLRKNQTGPVVSLTSVERETLKAPAGNNLITVNSTTLDLSIFANAGNDAINVLDSAGFVTVDTGSETPSFGSAGPTGDTLTINGDTGTLGDLPASVRLVQSDTVAAITVGAGGTLRIDGDAVLCVAGSTGAGTLSADIRGVVDLAGGALLFRDGGQSLPIRQWITAGRNGGAWNGIRPGGSIHSSLAGSTALSDLVGYGFGGQTGLSSIGPFVVHAGDTLIRYTLAGDANLDAKVDISDLAILATNWQASGAVFAQADFDYDNVTDVSDLSALATNWSLSLPRAAAPFGRAPIAARPMSRQLLSDVVE